MESERLLARVTLPANAAFVRGLRYLMMEAARTRVHAADELEALGALVEEVSLHVVRTAFDPGDDGEYTAELLDRGAEVVFAVEDKGLPDASGGSTPALAAFLPATGAHGITFRNLGRGGKRLEVARHVVSPEQARPPADAAREDPPAAGDEVALRLIEPADAPGLARLIYRAYGYTYGSEFVYFPEQLAALLASGRIVSTVAVNGGGEIVGHLAMMLNGPDPRTGETAMAAVDPRYRGRRLFERMKEAMGRLAGDRGILGLYSEAVAVHTFTQKGNLALGGFETGFLLGFTPPTQVFRNIAGGADTNRRAAVLFYVRTGPEPYRAILAPRHHAAIIAATVERGGMNREVIPEPVERPLRALRGVPTLMEVAARPDLGRAILGVRTFGGDVLERVLAELKDLCRKGFSCIYLELSLFDPMTTVLCKGFESFGFFYAGIRFEAEEGDVLRLQYLNGVAVDPSDIRVASDFGRRLLDYVLDARARVEARRSQP